MSWLTEYSDAAARTDRIADRPNHTEMLAAGLFGEAGSVLAELKKEDRETQAYPAYRNRLVEELGDLLWYLARFSTVAGSFQLADLDPRGHPPEQRNERALEHALTLGAAIGELCAQQQAAGNVAVERLQAVWSTLFLVATSAGISLYDAARQNLAKIESRWPYEHQFIPFFDDSFEEWEQLPRKLDVEFHQIERSGTKVVILRCNGLNFGDRLTDNIKDPDFYRFHDVFHLAYAVYLGWSPVIRSLLNCKRKSDPRLDDNQDGARAGIIEEAVSAVVFSRAKEMEFYRGIDHVDYDLLKTIQEFVRGFEVEQAPLWQWEKAILEGYRVFRVLRENNGGKVTLDMLNRELCCHERAQVREK